MLPPPLPPNFSYFLLSSFFSSPLLTSLAVVQLRFSALHHSLTLDTCHPLHARFQGPHALFRFAHALCQTRTSSLLRRSRSATPGRLTCLLLRASRAAARTAPSRPLHPGPQTLCVAQAPQLLVQASREAAAARLNPCITATRCCAPTCCMPILFNPRTPSCTLFRGPQALMQGF